MADVPNSATALPQGPNFRRVLLLDIVVPLMAVVLLERNGVSALGAYAVASVFPIGSVAVAWIARRSLDVIGVGVVLGVGSGLLLGALTADPRFALVRAAPGFALFGIAALLSLFTARPLMFFVARAFAAGGDPARMAAWNLRLAVPPFQQAMRTVTAVWGLGTLIEAALAIACAFLLPGQLALVAEPIVAFGIIAALLAWTRGVQRRAPIIEA